MLTRAPAPVGRKRVLTKSAVHKRAEELSLTVLTPATLRDAEVQREIASYKPDAVAVVAYGMLVPPELLNVPTHGWINLHFSMLPKWRGAAPVQYAIAAGDRVTGTAVFQIDTGLDTGPVFDVVEHEIAPSDTAGSLLGELSLSGARQLSDVLSRIERGEADAQPQKGSRRSLRVCPHQMLALCGHSLLMPLARKLAVGGQLLEHGQNVARRVSSSGPSR